MTRRTLLLSAVLLTALSAAPAAVQVAGELTWPQALEQVLRQDSQARCVAVLEPGAARTLAVSGETDEVMPTLAAQFGLQAVQLYGVWLVARAPEPADGAAVFLAALATPHGPLADLAATPPAERMVQLAAQVKAEPDALAARLVPLWTAVKAALGPNAPPSGVVVGHLPPEWTESVRRLRRRSGILQAASQFYYSLPDWTYLHGVRAADGRLALVCRQARVGAMPPDLPVGGVHGQTAGEPAAAQLRAFRPSRNTQRDGLIPAAWNQPCDLELAGSPAELAAAVLAQTEVALAPVGVPTPPLRVRLWALPVWTLPDLLLVALGEPGAPSSDAWTYHSNVVEQTRCCCRAMCLFARALVVAEAKGLGPASGEIVWQALRPAHRAELAQGGRINRSDLDAHELRAIAAGGVVSVYHGAFGAAQRSEIREVDPSRVWWSYQGDAVLMVYAVARNYVFGLSLPGGSDADWRALCDHMPTQNRIAEGDWTFARQDGAYLPRGRSSSPPAAP